MLILEYVEEKLRASRFRWESVAEKLRCRVRYGKKRSWPVSRVLSNTFRCSGSHSSGPAVACRLEQPTRGQREPRYCPPIWSCSGWGLPCRFCYQKRGGLLPGDLATVHVPQGTRTVDLSATRAPCGAHTVSPSPFPLLGLGQTILCGTFHRLTASGR